MDGPRAAIKTGLRLDAPWLVWGGDMPRPMTVTSRYYVRLVRRIPVFFCAPEEIERY
jgi:hypothetical protein